MLGSLGGIGATIAQPFQWAANGMLGNNAEGRANMADNLSRLGNTNSSDYKAGKLFGDVYLTKDVGSILGVGAKALGLTRTGNAIASGGFNLGAPAAKAFSLQGLENAGLRVAGGAINGGASAGLVNPNDAGTGAVIGGAIPIASKVLGETGSLLYNGAKKAIAPFTEAGRKQILLDNITKMMGDNASTFARNMANAKGATEGFTPMAGQVSGSHELAAFQRMFQQRNSGLMQPAVDAQRTALAAGANRLGGTDLERAALDSARSDAVNSLYANGKADMIESSPALEALFKRPAIANAVNAAKLNASNRGADGIVSENMLNGVLHQDGAPDYIGTKTTNYANSKGINGVGDFSVNPIYSGKTLQDIKFALDAAKKFNPNASTGERMTQSGVMDASTAFNKFLTDNVPDMRKADAIYSDMSKPINQMDLGNAIRDKFIPALERDKPTPSQLNIANIGKIVNDTGDTLARQVTGFKGATLNDSLSANQQQTLKGLLHDSQIMNDGNKLGAGINSSTYQHLAYNAKGEQNGLLDGLLSTTKTGKVLGAVKSMTYSATGSVRKLDNQMADMLMNPNTTGEQIQARLSQLSQPKRDSIVKLLAQQSVSKVLPIASNGLL
jgi:hypothetical protein